MVGAVSLVVRQDIADPTQRHELVLGAPDEVAMVAEAPEPPSPSGAAVVIATWLSSRPP